MNGGFDCLDYYAEHCYLVDIPRNGVDAISFMEVFGHAQPEHEAWAPECILRATLARAKWNTISKEVRLEFNRRLKADKKRAGRWVTGPNGVQRLLGKELLVLVWSIEQASVGEEQTFVAVRNWLGLKPEERWWLYTMTAAATGFASQQGMGWREALRCALTFGTDKDAANLRIMAERGQLKPRESAAPALPNKHKTGTV